MMNPPVGAIITGGDYQGLAVLRTLASKGIPIVLLDHEYCISMTSKYKKRFYKAPSPSNADGYLNFLMELVQKENLDGWVIFPNNDEIVYVLSKYHHILSQKLRVTTPPFDITKYVYDKKLTYQFAEENGIPTPKCYYAESLDALSNEKLKYPLVIKPSIKDHFYCKIKKKAIKVNNEAELITSYKEVNSVIDSSEILVQEFINGGPKNLYSFCPFIKNNKVLASITARRSRQHPMDFGHATTFAETVDIPELKNVAIKFLSLINYYGIAEVEFMYDAVEDIYKLIEVNPRVWGWHSLAIAAGVDLPYMLFQDMIGRNGFQTHKQNNLKWIRETTDTLTVASEILKGHLTLSEYFKSISGKKELAVFSLKDPFPFFAEILLLPYLWKKRGF